MKKQSSTVEWHYLDTAGGEEAWAQYWADGQNAPAQFTSAQVETSWAYNARWRKILLPLAVALCLLATSAGYWLWQNAQRGLAKIRHEIELAAMTDLSECVDAVAASPMTRLDAQATNEPRRTIPAPSEFCQLWRPALADYVNRVGQATAQQLSLRLTVENVELNESFALVNVWLNSPTLPASAGYRAALLFQQTDAGWRYSTSAPSLFWGADRTVESPLLRMHFHERDAVELTAIADALGQQYAAWRAAFGLPDEPPQPLIIESVTTYAEPTTEFWANPPRKLAIPSPLLFVHPADQPKSAEFEQRASRFLQLHVIDEAMRTPTFLHNQPLPDHWQSMLDGFYFALERAEPATQIHKQARELNLPLSLITFVPGTTQTVFTSVADQKSDRGWIVFSRPSLNLPGKYWVAESVAEYILQTYAPEQIAAMLRVLPEHESWDTLAPAVFSMDAQTFQAKWRNYVATHYPLQ